MLDAFGASALVVAIAEIGDKTQLLAIVLAATYRKPVPIILGILVATLANHAAAAAAGYFVAELLSGTTFRVVIGLAFVAMAGWALIPDKADDSVGVRGSASVFVATTIAFFVVEIGDKTQLATSLLAARYHDIAVVTLGTTAGMMLANVPAVIFGEAITRIVPLKAVRSIAAVAFAAIGVWVLVDVLG